MIKQIAIFLLLPLISACSTDPVAPALMSFSSATQTAVGTHLALVQTDRHTKQVKAARLRALANEGAAYEAISGSDCLYINPALRRAPSSFGESCKPKLVDASGDIVATYFDPPAKQREARRVVDALPGDQAVMQKHEGIQLARSLQSYAEALANMSSSTAPQDVGNSISSAITAIGELHGTVDSIGIRQGVSDSAVPNFSRFAGITSALTNEILEARRYRLLKQVVIQADPFVRIASRQLAILTFEAERKKIDPAIEALRNASTSFDAETIVGIGRTEDALHELRTADNKAAFRHFDKLQQSHAAILASFNAPRSAENLAAANTRINDFLDAVKSK